MAFNPIPAPDPATWALTIAGLVEEPLHAQRRPTSIGCRASTQNSRLKCVQCWSGRVNWEGFRAQDLLKLTRAEGRGRLGPRRLRRQLLRLREARGPAAPAHAVRDRHERRSADARARRAAAAGAAAQVRLQVVEADHVSSPSSTRAAAAWSADGMPVLFGDRRHPARRRSSVRVPGRSRARSRAARLSNTDGRDGQHESPSGECPGRRGLREPCAPGRWDALREATPLSAVRRRDALKLLAA